MRLSLAVALALTLTTSVHADDKAAATGLTAIRCGHLLDTDAT